MENNNKKLSSRGMEKISKQKFEGDIKDKFKEEDGWFLTDKGFPDYILFNKNTKELIFYELKVNGHNFHCFQKQLMKILKNGENRNAIVIRYRVNRDTKDIKLLEEKNAEEAGSKGWEGVKDIGIIKDENKIDYNKCPKTNL